MRTVSVDAALVIAGHFAGSDQIIEMRQGFADGEERLVRIERTGEQGGHHIRGRGAI